MGTFSPYVSNEQRGTSNRLLPPDTANIDRYSESEVVNFTITEVIGENVTIVLPLMKPYTEGSEYRKYTERDGWFTFDDGNVSDNLRYAQGELGFCPPPE